MQKRRDLSAMKVLTILAFRRQNLVVSSAPNVSTNWLNSSAGVTGCNLNDLLLSVDDLQIQSEKVSDQKALSKITSTQQLQLLHL